MKDEPFLEVVAAKAYDDPLRDVVVWTVVAGAVFLIACAAAVGWVAGVLFGMSLGRGEGSGL